MEQFLRILEDVLTHSSLVFNTLLISLLAGLLPLLEKYVKRWFGKGVEETYSQKLKRLTTRLTNASLEMDNLLAELGSVARDRAASVERLDADLKKLAAHESEL